MNNWNNSNCGNDRYLLSRRDMLSGLSAGFGYMAFAGMSTAQAAAMDSEGTLMPFFFIRASKAVMASLLERISGAFSTPSALATTRSETERSGAASADNSKCSRIVGWMSTRLTGVWHVDGVMPRGHGTSVFQDRGVASREVTIEGVASEPPLSEEERVAAAAPLLGDEAQNDAEELRQLEQLVAQHPLDRSRLPTFLQKSTNKLTMCARLITLLQHFCTKLYKDVIF